ncbi:MAG TPA: hypothetical protein DHW82_12380, partial [Spirochaetia bacterium]|nr:hypothetical protein [Spirochaetia bacterium]
IIIEINSGSDRLEKLANKITQKILPQKKIPPRLYYESMEEARENLEKAFEMILISNRELAELDQKYKNGMIGLQVYCGVDF